MMLHFWKVRLFKKRTIETSGWPTFLTLFPENNKLCSANVVNRECTATQNMFIINRTRNHLQWNTHEKCSLLSRDVPTECFCKKESICFLNNIFLLTSKCKSNRWNRCSRSRDDTVCIPCHATRPPTAWLEVQKCWAAAGSNNCSFKVRIICLQWT